MNPLANVKSLNKINDREIQMGVVGTASSWHYRFRNSAWIFFGGIPYELTEGDIICVFSQYGEIMNINLVRDKKTGKSKGYGFICYEDQRSTDLAVDNFNGIQIIGRTIRVDHVLNYRPPKDDEDENDIIKNFLQNKGCAPEVIEEKLKQLKESNKLEGITSKDRNYKKEEYDYKLTKIKKEKVDSDDNDNDNLREMARQKTNIKIKKEKIDSDEDNDRIRENAKKKYNEEKLIKIKKERNSDEDNDDVRDLAKTKQSKYEYDVYKNNNKKEKRNRSRSKDRKRSRSRSRSRYERSNYHHHKNRY